MSKVVTFGEIMLRLSTERHLRFSQAKMFAASYGGGEFNVAVSLANYGIPVEFVTRLPKNEIGACALKEMRKFNVQNQNVIYGGDRLGIYFLETGAGGWRSCFRRCRRSCNPSAPRTNPYPRPSARHIRFAWRRRPRFSKTLRPWRRGC